MSSYVLQAGSVLTPGGMVSPGWVAIEDGLVAETGPGIRLGATDLGECVVAPGFVDVHVHGGGGAQFNVDDPAGVGGAVARITRFHAMHGTTSLLATTVSDTPERLQASVRALAGFMGEQSSGAGRADGGNGDGASAGGGGGAVVRGVHLEGPFLARAKMGAQDPAALRSPDAGEMASLMAVLPGAIKLVTLAPELLGAPALAAAVLAGGARVAIGHTDAGYEETMAGIEAGATHATHLFNAMPPVHHRMPGAVTALLLDERVTLEVIADLEHVHPAVLALVCRVAPGRVVAVSDAVAATGLGPGTYRLGRLDVAVDGDRVTLASNPRTLAGSMLTMEVAVRNLVRGAGLALPAALTAASATPARACGLDALGVGRLAPGSPADVVVLDAGLSVRATVVGGGVVYDRDGVLG